MTSYVVRPDSTPTGATNFTIFGGAPSVNAALADNSTATYVKKGVSGNGAVIVGFATQTIPDSERVEQVRLRAQIACPTTASRLRLTPITRVNGSNYSGSTQSYNGIYALGEQSGGWFTTAPDGQAWDQDRINGLRAQIADAATSSDLSFVYELFYDIQTTSQPTVSVTSPTGTITNTSKPEISWTYSDAAGSDQDFYQVKVFGSTQYAVSGFNPDATTATWDSGVTASSDNTTGIQEHLIDGTWRAYVKVAKLVSGAPFYSPYSYAQFIVNTTPPTVPSLVATYSQVINRVTVSIAGATVSGAFDSQVFELERSVDNGVTWADVTGGSGLVPNGLNEATSYDYEAPRGQDVLYRTRSIGTLGEDSVASAWSSTALVTVTNDGTWWFKPVTAPSISVGSVRVAGGFGVQRDEQVGVFRPIGRANAVVVSSGLQGEDGEYAITTTGPVEFTNVWKALIHTGSMLVQTPEPEQRLIRIVERQYERGGNLGSVVNTIKVKYVEVDS